MKSKSDNKRRTMIGGQALMEGVMMRGATSMAMTVRASNGALLTETKRLAPRRWYNKVPIIRGCVSFVSSLIGGTGALLRSAEVIYPEEETPSRGGFAFAAILGLALAIALFIVVPSLIVGFIPPLEGKVLLSSLLEGGIRLVLFVAYLLAVSRMKDIRRTFMYHGAEHRTINCYEKGMELTVENVQKCSTRHNRCGTTFLFFVMVVSILLFSVANGALYRLGWVYESKIINNLVRLGVRLALLPLVAGLSFELLRLLAILPDNKFVNVLRAPGLALQRLTTYPPEDEMTVTAITSFLLVKAMDEDPAVPAHAFGEMTMEELRAFVGGRLTGAGVTEAAETDWIICEALCIKRGEITGHGRTTREQYLRAAELTEKRCEGVPLDYVVGKSEFYGLKIKVNKSVLVPRLDTEILADEAIKEIKRRGEGTRFLDLMTGSGCIALAVAENTAARVYASDISRRALAVAEENFAGREITTYHSDVFVQFPPEKFDVIASNPPYIRSGEIEALAPEVKCQPRRALDGGEDGLDLYRRIAKEAPAHMTDGGTLLLEIGYDEREAVEEILRGKFTDIECIKDYGGNDRVIKCTLKSGENAQTGCEKAE